MNINGTISLEQVPTAVTPVINSNIPILLGYYVKSKELATLKAAIFQKFGTS